MRDFLGIAVKRRQLGARIGIVTRNRPANVRAPARTGAGSGLMS
jgi:hypothetical protein